MRRLKTLIKKEIMDILRDKKTLIIMVVVPLLLYPALIIGMTLGMSMFMMSQEEKVHIVGYEGNAAEAEVVVALQELYEENIDDLPCKLEFKQMEVPAVVTETLEAMRTNVVEENDMTAGTEKTEVTDVSGQVTESLDEDSEEGMESDVWLAVTEDEKGSLMAGIIYTSTEQDSSYAQSALSDLLDIYKDDVLAEKLALAGLTEAFLHPVTIESEDLASESESFGMSIGGSIGMMLVVTILMGAFYPAVDVTTGEKERGTLETLLTLPVSNFQMIMSKYVAVSLFAGVTAILSLLALGGSVVFLMFGVNTELSAEFQGMNQGMLLTWIPVLLISMITTALLITAVCMCFCVFAKSMKEANNYSTPVMLIVMFASMIAMIPTVELNYQTALIPFANISLLLKQIIAQQLDLSLAGVTNLVNFVYSVLIIWILAKMYDSEDILFHDGFRSFNLFKKRSEMEKGTIPDVGDLIITTVIVLLLILYLGTAVSARDIFVGTVVNQVIILAVPLIMVWYLKSDFKTLLSLRKPGKGTILPALILYIGVYCLAMVAGGIMTQFFPESSESMNAAYELLLEKPMVLVAFVMALMPGIGEELMFRGFLHGGFRHKYGTKWAIVISSLIFGAFHMSMVKLLSTAMLGACFSYILSVSGSIYIGMVLHFTNNVISLMPMKYPELSQKLLPFLTKETYSVGEIVIVFAVGIICTGLGVLLLNKKKEMISRDLK